MSLINYKNLFAPLGSKIQMGALIILAFLVFVVRLAGSTIEQNAPIERDNGSKAQFSNFLDDQQQLMQSGKQGKGDSKLNDLLDSTSKGSTNRPRINPSNETEPELLNDIKRKLGLE
jgi:hypothetical protein